MKRYALWALLVIVVWWVIQDPAAAAGLVHEAGQALTHAASSLSAFASDASTGGK